MRRSTGFFGVCVICLTFSGPDFAQEVSKVAPGTSVKLPSFDVHPKWKQAFPPDHPFFSEKYPDGTVQGVHARYLARLNGPSVTFHENGKLKSLAYYPDGDRQGPCYLWNDEQELAAYFQSKGGKANGIACLFKEGKPYLVQRWIDGTLDKETLVTRKDDAFLAVDGGEQLSAAQEKLTALMNDFAASEKELKASLRKSASDASKQVDDAKAHAAKVASTARMKADIERSRQEADAMTAAAHTSRSGVQDRTGRVASADERFASEDAKAASKKATAAAADQHKKLEALASSLNGQAKELYIAALTALETALPSESTDSVPVTEATTPKVFIVKWQEGKKGRSHVDEVVAETPADAEAHIRHKHRDARFKSVSPK